VSNALPPTSQPPLLDRVAYDNDLVGKFLIATLIWGVVGFLVGLIVAAQLVLPVLNFEIPWLTFGRLRPLHTNAVIFAFAGNAIFAGVCYSVPRLLKARLCSDLLGRVHFWGWQLIIVLAAVTLPLGLTTSKEYAELEWPIKLLIAVIWVIFGANLIGTLFKRRERHLYVAIWFFIATWIAVTMLHLVNSASIPVSLAKSYSLYAGIQDALVQWWYGHNAVAFFLTTPFLGLLYYFLPKATGKPIYSYKLSILHFWSLIFIYIWAGPHHLLNASTPEWAQTLGVMFSLMLIIPSWGGALNGYMTIFGKGGSDVAVRKDPIIWFWLGSITSYTITTFEGCMLSLRDINALSHNTDWTIGHVHNGAIGWVGLMVFAIFYWMVPRLWKTQLWSTRLVKVHFWLAISGLVLYVVALWIAGIIQGVMQLSFTETGHLATKSFMEVVHATIPWHWVRLGAGVLYFAGMVICAYNLLRTIAAAPKIADDVVEVAPLAAEGPVGEQVANALSAPKAERITAIHGLIERWPLALLVLATIALSIGSVVEIIPHLVQGALTPTISTVKPYTPLELHGRDLYIKEGCSGCHTQLIRTIRAETERYGNYTLPGEHIYDRPFLWGSKRTGPDLAREGVLRPSAAWHYAHLVNPQATSPGSVMPPYPWLARDDMDLSILSDKLAVLAAPPLYTPYSKSEIDNAVELALAQAEPIADALRKDPALANAEGLEKKDIVAVIAYLQRLGTDLNRLPAPGEK
jgi:cytochrome c oxidase cbb3-type subunit I/II